MYDDGSTKKVQDLQVGERLMGDDSTPRTILSTTGRRVGPMFRVTPEQKSPADWFECNDEHILVLKFVDACPTLKHCTANNHNNEEEKEENAVSHYAVTWIEYDAAQKMVKEQCKIFPYDGDGDEQRQSRESAIRFMESISHDLKDFVWEVPLKRFLSAQEGVQRRARMYMPGRVQFKEREGFFRRLLCEVLDSCGVERSMNDMDRIVAEAAWLLGTWIVKGARERIVVDLENAPEMVDAMHNAARTIGLECTVSEGLVHLSSSKGANVLAALLHRLGMLDNVHIPDGLMHDEIDHVRLHLLAGLLDAAGLSSSGALFGFERFAASVRHLVNTCGFRSNKPGSEATNSSSSSSLCVEIQGPNLSKIPFRRASNKTMVNRAPYMESMTDHLHWSFEIESLGEGDYFGFTVDGNERMLLSDLTVTHNTSELLRRIKRYEVAKKKVLLIKYMHDERYSKECISTHDKEMVFALPTDNLSKVAHAANDYDVIGIDEGQFFPDLLLFCEEAANHGKIVIVSALDGTFQRKSFGQVCELIPLAESVMKLHSVCMICQRDAAFSLRTTSEMETEVIGGQDKYIAACRRCYMTNQS